MPLAINADQLAEMIDAGLTPEQITTVLRILERDERDARAKAADRARAYRNRKRDAPRDDPRDDITVVPETPAPRAHVVNTSLPSGEVKNSSLRSESEAVAPLDATDRLWSEGLQTLSDITGKPANALRSVVGRWRKPAGINDAQILGAIIAARDNRIIDPIGWITQHLAKSNEPRNVRSSQSRHNLADALDRFAPRRPGGTDHVDQGAFTIDAVAVRR